MKKSFIMSALMLLACVSADAQMLKCEFRNFKATDDNVAVYYSPERKMLADVAVPVKWAADGSFTCDLDVESADLTLYVGDNDTFGAHMEKGKKACMVITRNGDNTMTTDFSGDNKDLSRVVSQMNDAYSISRYFPMGGREPEMSEYLPMLDSMYQSVVVMLKKVKDKKQRAEYTEWNEYLYKFMKVRLILEDTYKTKKKITDYPEYSETVKDVDINSDLSYRSYLASTMLSAYHKTEVGEGRNMEPYCRESMEICDKYVTNPKLRKATIEDIGKYYFVYGDGTGNPRKFYADLTKWAGADSTLVVQYKKVMDSWEKTKAGTKAFDITLTDADGNNIQLLDLVKGKFAYIDVWATWCGPCRNEIPHFAKLAEKYDGKNDIIFISISIDENVKAWKKMIGEEKPAWAQYNINSETSKTFSSQWGITGIPRFIMIDKEGNIKAAEAPRPSSEAAEKALSEIANE